MTLDAIPNNVIVALAKVREIGAYNMFDRVRVTGFCAEIDEQAYDWLRQNKARYMDALNAMGKYATTGEPPAEPTATAPVDPDVELQRKIDKAQTAINEFERRIENLKREIAEYRAALSTEPESWTCPRCNETYAMTYTPTQHDKVCKPADIPGTPVVPVVKLTKAQREMLGWLNHDPSRRTVSANSRTYIEGVLWGKIAKAQTVKALRKYNLIEFKTTQNRTSITLYGITPAGRAALTAHDARDK